MAGRSNMGDVSEWKKDFILCCERSVPSLFSTDVNNPPLLQIEVTLFLPVGYVNTQPGVLTVAIDSCRSKSTTVNDAAGLKLATYKNSPLPDTAIE